MLTSRVNDTAVVGMRWGMVVKPNASSFPGGDEFHGARQNRAVTSKLFPPESGALTALELHSNFFSASISC